MLSIVISAALALGPISPAKLADIQPARYYASSCSRCHGDEARSLSAPLRAAARTDVQLKVKRMAEGSAQAPLKPGKEVVVADLLLSWSQDKPFVAAVKVEGTKLYYEAPRGVQVKADVKGRALKAGKERGQTFFNLSSSDDAGAVRLTASAKGRTRSILLSEEGWTSR
jgi:predicted nucleic-acid-binding Zn-ribbon protein